MQTSYKRIAEVDRVLTSEEVHLYPNFAIWLALKVGLAIAAGINELTQAVDDVARKLSR